MILLQKQVEKAEKKKSKFYMKNDNKGFWFLHFFNDIPNF